MTPVHKKFEVEELAFRVWWLNSVFEKESNAFHDHLSAPIAGTGTVGLGTWYRRNITRDCWITV